MGDTNRHIKNLKIESFKRFETLEIKDIGLFNLIVGDNNVGKTSVLEALSYEEPGWLLVNNLICALSYRKLKQNYKYADIELYLNKSSGAGKDNRFIKYLFEYKDNTKQVTELEFVRNPDTLMIKGIPNNSTGYPFYQEVIINSLYTPPFLPFYLGHDKDLANFYSKKIQGSAKLKKRFSKALQVMIPDFLNMELTQPDPSEAAYLILTQEAHDAPMPLAMFGDGTVKLFRILAEIVLQSGKRLMIDEVDAGIHYSKFKIFWKTIMEVAKENNVQLFMTTHNEECIKYFKEVLENELTEFQSEVRSIALVENNVTKQVEALTYSYSELEHALNVGNEIRG